MATQNGTDVQQNLISISSGICSFGEGGPAPFNLPGLPTPLVIDPANLWFLLPTGYTTNPQTYDASLKIGDNTKGWTLTGISVVQGFQDSLNLNNGASSNHIAGDIAVGTVPGLRAITIKGGSCNNTVTCSIHQAGTSETIKLGDWSDQSYASSTGNDLSGTVMSDGSKVSVVIGRASSNKLPANHQILWLDSAGLICYWWFKRLVRLIPYVNGTKGIIPLGTPGPSWLA